MMRKCVLIYTALFVCLVSTSFDEKHPKSRYCSQTNQPTVFTQYTNDALNNKNLSKGKFLIAREHLLDPNFSETVVLLIEYGNNGTIGLIINRPTSVKLSAVFPDLKGVRRRKDTIYIGGPVNINELYFLTLSEKQPEDSFHIFDNVYLSSSLVVLEQVLLNRDKKERIHVYAGHAGWAPGQLELEIMRGDWNVLPANIESIFFKDPPEIWTELIYRSSGQWI
jgi:putative transcriptional regulator